MQLKIIDNQATILPGDQIEELLLCLLAGPTNQAHCVLIEDDQGLRLEFAGT